MASYGLQNPPPHEDEEYINAFYAMYLTDSEDRPDSEASLMEELERIRQLEKSLVGQLKEAAAPVKESTIFVKNREELIREIFKNPEDCDDVTILVQSSVKNTAAVRDDLASKKYFTVQGDTETAVRIQGVYDIKESLMNDKFNWISKQHGFFNVTSNNERSISILHPAFANYIHTYYGQMSLKLANLQFAVDENDEEGHFNISIPNFFRKREDLRRFDEIIGTSFDPFRFLIKASGENGENNLLGVISCISRTGDAIIRLDDEQGHITMGTCFQEKFRKMSKNLLAYYPSENYGNVEEDKWKRVCVTGYQIFQYGVRDFVVRVACRYTHQKTLLRARILEEGLEGADQQFYLVHLTDLGFSRVVHVLDIISPMENNAAFPTFFNFIPAQCLIVHIYGFNQSNPGYFYRGLIGHEFVSGLETRVQLVRAPAEAEVFATVSLQPSGIFGEGLSMRRYAGDEVGEPPVFPSNLDADDEADPNENQNVNNINDNIDN